MDVEEHWPSTQFLHFPSDKHCIIFKLFLDGHWATAALVRLLYEHQLTSRTSRTAVSEVWSSGTAWGSSRHLVTILRLAQELRGPLCPAWRSWTNGGGPYHCSRQEAMYPEQMRTREGFVVNVSSQFALVVQQQGQEASRARSVDRSQEVLGTRRP